jgi:hypothetical protein
MRLKLKLLNSLLIGYLATTLVSVALGDPSRQSKAAPNWATPIPLPGEPAFLTLTENRYVEIPGSSKTANCSYMERWSHNLHEQCDNGDGKRESICDGQPDVRYARKGSAAICYGASMYRPGKNPAVIIIRNTRD